MAHLEDVEYIKFLTSLDAYLGILAELVGQVQKIKRLRENSHEWRLGNICSFVNAPATADWHGADWHG